MDLNTETPLVSIVVPSYNHDRYIAQCIESIFAQSYRNFELTVIDDGSTDGTREILSRLQKEYGFTLVLQENMGAARTLNKGIKNYAHGKYVACCSSDDYWAPDKLEKQVAFMEQNPDVPMCYGKLYAVDEDSRILQDATEAGNKNLKGGYIFKDLLLINLHPPVNYMYRRSIFEEVGYYREDIFTEDLYMNLKVASKYRIGFIDDFLFYYRVIRDQKKKPITLKTSLAHLECINEYRDSEYYREAIAKWNFRNFIWYCFYTKHKLYALKGMLRSTRYIFNRHYLSSFVRLLLSWK